MSKQRWEEVWNTTVFSPKEVRYQLNRHGISVRFEETNGVLQVFVPNHTWDIDWAVDVIKDHLKSGE